jgi:Transcriptional Coactivator p15 (PC4)
METPSARDKAASALQNGNAPLKRSFSRRCYEFGEGRFLRMTARFVVFEDEIKEKRIVLNFQKYAKFTAKIVNIDEAIENQRHDARAQFRLDIGGSWFVSIGNGYRCVDIRKWFTDHNGKARPSRSCMSLRYDEWEKFKEIVDEIRQHRPDIASVIPCYMSGDHQNQEGTLTSSVSRFRLHIFCRCLRCRV